MRKCKTLIKYFRLKSDVITILKLRTDLIEKAVKLTDITKDTIVNDIQVKIVESLIHELHESPDFFKGPMEVRMPFGSVDQIDNYSPDDFYKDSNRVIFLRTWVLEVLPIIDLFSQVGKLPLTRGNEDLELYLQRTFNSYITSIEEIITAIPTAGITKNHLQYVKNLCEKIICSIQEYHKGFPAKAFNELRDGLINNLLKPGYFKNKIPSHAKHPKSPYEYFYKMRVGTERPFSSDEMFHIPLELRGIVSTNRYSIPGLPCVYLGSSALTCWEELNKPDLNTIQTSLLVSKKLNYLDLSIPPAVFIDELRTKFHRDGTIRIMPLLDEENGLHNIISYIILWPLTAACSVRVKNTTDTFKQEYIIPQLLLQFIRYDEFLDGVSYFSTKVDNYSAATATLYKNFAFPVQGGLNKGLCPKLLSKFEVSDAVPWNMFQLYKDSHHCLPHEEENRVEHEFIDGMSLLYSSTDFSKLETFLQNKFLLEKSIGRYD
ncbi:hypothetical protein AT257_21075 [Bacillus cereus]|nr:hypothetical protein AT257_21075 [Bacillus cereus]